MRADGKDVNEHAKKPQKQYSNRGSNKPDGVLHMFLFEGTFFDRILGNYLNFQKFKLFVKFWAI